MPLRSKTYAFSEEIHQRLDALKAQYGSYNKGLKVALEVSIPSAVASLGYEPASGGDSGHYGQLDATGSELSAGRGKVTTETRGMRAKGDTER